MRLFEHPDFEQVVLEAADHLGERGLRAAIIEKDYYVTEALRIIADTVGEKTIFKGGTSLSKGWTQYGLLCFGTYPSWEEVQVRFLGLRTLL